MAMPRVQLRVGLPLKFILSISLLIAVTSISLGVFFVRHDVALVTAELLERGRSLVRNLAFNGEYGVLIGNRELLETLVRGLIQQEDVLYVVIHDATGAVLAAGKAEQLRAIPSAGTPGRPWTEREWTDPDTRAAQIPWEGDTVYEVTHPIRTRQVRLEREALGFPPLPGPGERGVQRERTIGLARMGMSLSVRRVSETLTGLRQAITLALLLVGLAGIIVTVLLVRVIVRPINELVTGTARLREGELDYRVSVASRDEIGDLARSFNTMAHALRQREEELHARGEELGRLNALLTGQQEVLRRINAELAAASRHKSEFLASMSHELRTPLNAVIGFTELLAAGTYGLLPPRVEEPLQEIRHNAKRLMGLISDVLDLAKIEAGRMELSCAEYLVPDVVESVAATVRPLAQQKGLALVVEVEPGLPEGYGDAQRIRQALLNLVGNAVKFTEAGEIQIRACRQEAMFLFQVADTGIGVPGEVLDQIFEPFRQADASVTREHGGVGLGLSIAKRFVEMHGGRIWAESTPGRGSLFAFSIPIRMEQA
ncbi:MAG: HAMP domain-containing protein, partial [candidate division NC10 bacterium]|nr:HAMP domain-containing protein [candidate division NC10 bacterium]